MHDTLWLWLFAGMWAAYIAVMGWFLIGSRLRRRKRKLGMDHWT